MKLIVPILFFVAFHHFAFAQQEEKPSGVLSGSFEAQGNFFFRDTLIGAANTPQYDYEKFGAQSWFNLNYNNAGFDVGVRFDLYNNSNLIVPTDSRTAQGIGNWYVKKNAQKFDFAAGYLYDQIGSGIIFRAYEARQLAIDNALYGVKAAYHINKDWKVKVFTGTQKQLFDRYNSVIKGISSDAFFLIGDSTKQWSIAPGFGIVGKTLDKTSIEKVVATISAYTIADSITAQYNTYAFSAYNTLSAGNFTWYLEGAYKSKDLFDNPMATRTLADGKKALGKLLNQTGSVVFTSVSYADKGLGVTLEGKRTKNFTFRTTPFEKLNRGAINFLPPMTRQNTYRLTARYNAATQELGEQAVQGEFRYAINKKIGFFANFSAINDLDTSQLYREIYTELTYKQKKYNLIGGVQVQRYNQAIYETKPAKDAPMVKTFTPYVEFLYKFTRKKSIRTELQYMDTRQDLGSWVFGLVEYSTAPNWIFTLSDMYNNAPTKGGKKLHYPTLMTTYSKGSNRVSFGYVKQVAGVVCNGGVCRLEPAFSGVRLTLNSTF